MSVAAARLAPASLLTDAASELDYTSKLGTAAAARGDAVARPSSGNNLTRRGPGRPRRSSGITVRNPLRNGRAQQLIGKPLKCLQYSAEYARGGRTPRPRRAHRAGSGGETTVASTSERGIARSSQGPTRPRALFLTTLLAAA